jgi:thiamine-phosphate pyrophosphorylase
MTQSATWRILDAALNRAGEGLRVVEDYVRFVADDLFLTSKTKELRHELAAAAALLLSDSRHAARDTLADVGTRVSMESERRRSDAWDVCAASLKRTEQSLRSLEEYGKLVDADFAGRCENLRYRLCTLEKAIDVGRVSRERLESVRLCVLLDGRDSADEFEQVVSALVEASVGMIQLRDKLLDDRKLVERGRLLVRLTRSTATLAIINDRADIAAAVRADGVHLGQEDLSVKEARAVVGTRMLIGVSTHNIKQARTAVLDGANYLGAGPTFPSNTKEFNAFPGLEFLREVAAEIRLPTFAIGGINAGNLPDVLATGIEQVAVGGAVTRASRATEVALAVRTLLDMLKCPVAEAASPSGYQS